MAGMDKFRNTFREEATELLNQLEASVLQLEDNPGSEQDIAAVFRAMHTIKGSAAMFGFQPISHFTHEVENILDQVRAGRMKVTKDLIDTILEARDHILTMLGFEGQVPQPVEKRSTEILTALRSIEASSMIRAKDEPNLDSLLQGKAIQDLGPQNLPEGHKKTLRIKFNPRPDIMQNGTRPLALLRELMDLGECTIVVNTQSLPDLYNLKPEICYLRWEVMLTTTHELNTVRDVFLFVEDKAEISIELADIPVDQDDNEERSKLGEILVARGSVSAEDLEEAVARQPRLGSLLVEAGVPPEEVKAALEEQKHIRQTRQKTQAEQGSGSIRVASDKLDNLVDLVGELVTLQARLSQCSKDLGDGNLQHISESFERLSSELRDNTMSIRMLPIGSTFIRFKRLVRDLAAELGKSADLETLGGETELDKTVLERLQDPLVHLIRNAVDHGLESLDLRKKLGKPAQGNIRLVAEHAGSTVLIRIQDDGKGLDVGAIQKKAVEKGLVGASQTLTEQDAFDLIFQPGFSTARQISSVSGRGVGLDVVKKEIENLNGSVHVASKPGLGTTFTLEIPLTLAIIEGLLVKIGAEHYVFPLSLVEECLEFRGRAADQESLTIQNRGIMLPLLSLRNVLDVGGEEPATQQVVVVNYQGRKLGMLVDTVIGDHQTVIKNLGRLYRGNIGMSGATILGDGRVALILDILGLVGFYEMRARRTSQKKVG